MRSNSKIVRDKVKQHILDSVYDENGNEFKSLDQANEHLVNEFKRVADYPHNLKRLPNNQERFEDYLKGIPFNFEFEDYKIEEFLNGLGINPEGKNYSSDQMWRLYAYLIWREASPKYSKMKMGGTVKTDLIHPLVKKTIDSKDYWELKRQLSQVLKEMRDGLLKGEKYNQELEYLRQKVYEAGVEKEKKQFKSDLQNPKRKTVDLHYVQGNYGQGWEDLTAHDTSIEAKAELKVYDLNESYPHRKITRRVKKSDYTNGNYKSGGQLTSTYQGGGEIEYKITNIKYDTDDVSGLPKTLTIKVPANYEGDEADNYISDEISDRTGFTHKGFDTTPEIEYSKGGSTYAEGGDIVEDMEASDLELFESGGKTRSVQSWNRDRLWTSNEPHEQAYKSKRKSAIRRHGLDRVKDSQEPHEIASRKKNVFGAGGDLDHVMLEFGGDLDQIMFETGGDLDNILEKGGKALPRLKRGDSVMILGRRWFQKTFGNTYHSVEVFVNGELVGYVPFSYGYDDGYVQTGLKLLWEHYKPPYGWKESSPIWYLKDKGIKATYRAIDVDRKRDLETGGVIEALSPERDLDVTFAKGGMIGLLDKIKSTDTITEKEMNLLKLRINGNRVDPETAEVIDYIWNNDIMCDSDWSEKGLKFLMNQWKTPNGKERLNNPFGLREQEVLSNFGHFELAGFYDISRYGQAKFVVPLYDCCDKDGYCFQYYYDGKVNIVGKMGGLFGLFAPARSKASWNRDRLWTSNEPHEQAYKSKRKSAIRRHGLDRAKDSQEPHEIASRKKMATGGLITRDEALQTAINMGVDFDKDFHAQSFGNELSDLAKKSGYKKSASSSGSLGRAFFYHLQKLYDKK